MIETGRFESRAPGPGRGVIAVRLVADLTHDMLRRYDRYSRRPVPHRCNERGGDAIVNGSSSVGLDGSTHELKVLDELGASSWLPPSLGHPVAKSTPAYNPSALPCLSPSVTPILWPRRIVKAFVDEIVILCAGAEIVRHPRCYG